MEKPSKTVVKQMKPTETIQNRCKTNKFFENLAQTMAKPIKQQGIRSKFNNQELQNLPKAN